MDWSAADYRRFEDERTRPARDLLAQVTARVAAAVDLGCGPGNSTELLRARFPEARLTGIDSSPDMIAAARQRLPDVRFALADIASWKARAPVELVFANAVLQWLPDHAALLPRLFDKGQKTGALVWIVQIESAVSQPCFARNILRSRRIIAALDKQFARSLAQPDQTFRFAAPIALAFNRYNLP